MNRRDLEILEHLANVPGLTAELPFELGIYPTIASARRGLQRLLDARLVECLSIGVRPVEVSRPLHRAPEDGELDHKRLERELRSRYGTEAREDVFSIGQFRRPLQVSHELGVSRCYVRFQRERAPLGWKWTPEHPLRGGLVADAFLEGPSGDLVALDFCGEYRAPKLLRISSYWSSRNIPLELW